jgi:hypothetical protein
MSLFGQEIVLDKRTYPRVRKERVSQAGDQTGTVAAERWSWIIPLVVFFMTASVSGLVLYYYFGPPGRGGAQELPSPTESANPVTLTLGGEVLRVPANYILMASARRGGAVQQLAMIAVLPQLGGYAADAAEELNSNAPDSRAVNLTLKSDARVLPEQERLDRVYMTLVEDMQGKPGPYGLTQYAFRADSGYHEQDLFVAKSNAGPIVLLCTKPSADVPSPNCLRDAPVGKGLALSYRFKRAHLAQWRAIDTGLYALVDRFANKA